jgi:hypothetical protein
MEETMTEKPSRYTPPGVSRHFFYDWQFATDIYNATALRFVSLLLLFLPLIIDTEKVVLLSIPKGLEVSAVTFFAALVIIYLFCPRFIREYRDFGQYGARCHSHRWIVWEFYNNLKSLAGWRNIVRETVSKGLSLEIEQFADGEIKTELERILSNEVTEDTITIYKPVIINRDIYLPIRLEDQKTVLFLEEDDKKLAEKEKELFWILHTQAAKERVIARIAFWILIYATALIFFGTVFYTFSKIAIK